MRDPRERVHDILEAISNIEKYASIGRAEFDRDELIRTWCVRQLEIIGEAVRAIPEAVHDRAPSVPWNQISGMRNILIHGYFDVDGDLVWNAIESHVPSLKLSMQRLLADLEAR